MHAMGNDRVDRHAPMRILAILALALAAVLPCSAGQDDELFASGQQAFAQRDYRAALEFWTRAAESGHARALNGLGLLYRDGRGVDIDEKRAVNLFRDAAERGFTYAMYNLGMMIREGRGVQNDDIEARKWLVLAATLHFDQKARLQRDLIGRRMSEAQIAEADRRAQDWVNRALFGVPESR